jgi:hypothetical protein
MRGSYYSIRLYGVHPTLRFPLLEMQDAQSTCRFFSVFEPPCDKGIT